MIQRALCQQRRETKPRSTFDQMTNVWKLRAATEAIEIETCLHLPKILVSSVSEL